MRMGFNVRNKSYTLRRICVLGLLFFAIVTVCARLTPAYGSRAASYASAAVNDIVNSSVSEVFAGENGTFSIANNEILEADTVRINQMKSQLMAKIQDKLNTYTPQTVQIPLFAASKLPILTGMGPKIPLKIAPVSILSGELEESFESAGINQVKHTVNLKISVSVNCTGYMFSQNETVVTDVPVIETVIKGDIPKYYGANTGIIGE